MQRLSPIAQKGAEMSHDDAHGHGLGVIRVIQAVRAASLDIPVIFVSGIARPDLEAIVAGLGNAKIFRKPIAVSLLRSAICEMLVAREPGGRAGILVVRGRTWDRPEGHHREVGYESCL